MVIPVSVSREGIKVNNVAQSVTAGMTSFTLTNVTANKTLNVTFSP